MPRGVYPRRPRARKPVAQKTLTEAVADAAAAVGLEVDLSTLDQKVTAALSEPPVSAEQKAFDQAEEIAEPRRYLSGAPFIAPAQVPEVPANSSCAMVERLWRKKIPVWQCAKCRLDTSVPAAATCPRGLPK